jgi:hypothetical protein
MSKNIQWKQRRLASRALRILDRHQGKSLAVAAYQPTLGHSAAAFVAAYDQLKAFSTTRSGRMEQGRTATVRLLKLLRAWTAVAQPQVPGFDRSTFGDKPAVPDDVISDAEHFVQIIEQHNAEAQGPLGFTDGLMQELLPAIEAAKTEWSSAGLSRADHNELLAVVREASGAFSVDLVAFRQTLLAIIGRGHPDYQKLRVARARTDDDDDDAVAASLPEGAGEIDEDPEEEEGEVDLARAS